LKTRVVFSVSLLLLFTFLIISCNKKPDQVGIGLQPASAELTVSFDDNSGLLVHSVREDSVRTDGNAIKTGMLGSMMDPVFGLTTAEIFTQFRLPENGHDYGSDPVLDSIVLSLAYSGFYGDTASQQSIRVYELSGEMFPDSVYYSNQSIPDDGQEIASVIFVPMPGDSITVGGNPASPQLRIRLSDEFGQKLMNAASDVYSDNESWLAFMKGLRITSDPALAGGGIMLFDMLATNTALTIYYRTGEPQDTLSFAFVSNSNCARFTAFDHNGYLDALPEFRAQVLEQDTTLGMEKFYLQSMGGVKAQIRLPDIIDYFKDGPVAINEAKLIFYINDDGSGLTAPQQLGLALIDEEGNFKPLPDAGEAGSYYGGMLNANETEYYFRISRHVQRVLTGQSANYPLALLISGASFRANRVVLHGPDQINGEMRMRLNVIYTVVQ
jgi:hypothetical protein